MAYIVVDPDVGFLPCPFCGQAATLLDLAYSGKAQARCDNAACDVKPRTTCDQKATVIAAWNRRAKGKQKKAS